jgi:hypothetical protein
LAHQGRSTARPNSPSHRARSADCHAGPSVSPVRYLSRARSSHALWVAGPVSQECPLRGLRALAQQNGRRVRATFVVFAARVVELIRGIKAHSCASFFLVSSRPTPFFSHLSNLATTVEHRRGSGVPPELLPRHCWNLGSGQGLARTIGKLVVALAGGIINRTPVNCSPTLPRRRRSVHRLGQGATLCDSQYGLLPRIRIHLYCT